jgi:hypothetical protein
MRPVSTLIVASLALSSFLPAAWGQGATADKDLKVVVPGVYAYEGVPKGAEGVLSDLLLNALLSRHNIQALGPADARAMLTAEQQRSLLGCNDETCMAELAGALGADWLIGGSVGKLDDLYVLSIQLIDARKAKVTSRATATLKNLKVAPARIGPLVDELLGARPHLRKTPPVLSQPPRQPVESMDRETFCRLNQAYVDQLLKPYDSRLVDMRREILADFVITPFKRQFVGKQTCIWPHQGRMSNVLKTQLNLAETREQALDAKRRYWEYGKFIDQVKLLEDEYVRGLEMEKNGTGRRLAAVPFKIEETALPVPPDTPQVRAYREIYAEAIQVLARALEAAKKGDQKAFVKLFTPRDPAVSRTKPESAFNELAGKIKNGYSIQICPLEVYSVSDIEAAASRYPERKRVDGCWRYVKGTYAGTDTVRIVKHKGKWLIDSW